MPGSKNLREDCDPELKKLLTGPKITAMASESNNGRVHIQIDGDETLLVPGQCLSTFGYGLVVFCERGGDSCHVTVG